MLVAAVLVDFVMDSPSVDIISLNAEFYRALSSELEIFRNLHNVLQLDSNVLIGIERVG